LDQRANSALQDLWDFQDAQAKITAAVEEEEEDPAARRSPPPTQLPRWEHQLLSDLQGLPDLLDQRV